VSGGAIALALALEANGYTHYKRSRGMLADGIQAAGRRQCAICPKKEDEHKGNNANVSHTFSPAYYGILTGDTDISPNNEDTITTQRASNNATGLKMKVIIGSQIASEGVDLRFVRETHLLDAWYHLNKTEQILGRAIRFLSHCALEKEKRNNTVYLYASVMPGENRETADLYNYRTGFNKAVLIGNVTRVMKQSSLDCNLNHDAIIISGQDTVQQIDSQRELREEVDINDMPFTAICDWIETCNYECSPKIDIKAIKLDDSTYDEYSARWRIYKVKEQIKKLFAEQAFYQSENIWEFFSDVPRIALIDVMNEIINNKTFQVQHKELKGYIRYCNGYYIFQPNVYTDLSIPLAIRSSQFPIKRDMYLPTIYEMPELVEENEVGINESIEDIWAALTEWITGLSQNPKYIKQPNELSQWFVELSHDDAELRDVYSQNVEMIYWFFVSFHKSPNKNPNSFVKAIMEYFWDEWLTVDEQKFLVYNTEMDVSEYIEENQRRIDSKTVIDRFMNPKTNNLDYTQTNEKEAKKFTTATQVFIDYIKRNTDEPLQQYTVTPRTTGKIYGFIVPKNGMVVFKTAAPPEGAEKLGRGKECANVSTMTGHIVQLVNLGDILSDNGKGDFDLTIETIVGRRRIVLALP